MKTLLLIFLGLAVVANYLWHLFHHFTGGEVLPDDPQEDEFVP